ncbi:hypothetical protein [Streptomyces sp. NBC_01353]|uniref:hypothetical protein n=1 Tax=Streptomyces sp. NBC_01353 TaxID=2903835 RepID=UPI002E3735CF|nr:hypothetical protein [Streptomyces sp. NBC_01353]
MSETGLILRTAQDIANQHGLLTEPWPHFAHPDGRLHLAAVIFRAVTGKTPAAFTNDLPKALLLIQTNETVMGTLRWISAVLPTEPPHDEATGEDDHLEHIATWLEEPDFFTQRRPNTSDVIGVLGRTAQTADTLTDLPRQRTTDESYKPTARLCIPAPRHAA